MSEGKRGRNSKSSIITPTVVVLSLIVFISHLVGFWGFTNSRYFDLTKQLVPWYVIAMFLFIIISHQGRNNDFWKFILVTYIAGFVFQLLGVASGQIFGEFRYENTLGFTILEVPVIIGLNWIIVIYCTGCTMRMLGVQKRAVRSAIGALLITILDYLIEPVAIRHEYWSWNNYDVPVQNYVAWYIISFLMLAFFNHMRIRKRNVLAPVLLICQFVFFWALNVVLL